MSPGNVPGASGIVFIIGGLIVVSAIITQVTGCYGHWVLVALGILTGLMAVRSINR